MSRVPTNCARRPEYSRMLCYEALSPSPSSPVALEGLYPSAAASPTGLYPPAVAPASAAPGEYAGLVGE